MASILLRTRIYLIARIRRELVNYELQAEMEEDSDGGEEQHELAELLESMESMSDEDAVAACLDYLERFEEV